MPTNNTLIMMGLGLAALFMLRNRDPGGPQEYQASQLAGASMMAAGEGTAPDAPFQQYSAPANPVFFFNQGGQMAQVPGSNVPLAAASDEDIGVYPGRNNKPELEFEVAPSQPPAGTTDTSPTTPEFAGTGPIQVTPATIWDEQVQIAEANFMPALAIQDTGGGGIDIIGANVDIATMSSQEKFRAVNLDTAFAFTTSGSVLQEYVKGFTNGTTAPTGPTAVISQTVPNPAYVPAITSNLEPGAIDQWWDEG